MRVEHLAVAEDSVDRGEGHGGVEVFWHRLGGLRPVHDAAPEDTARLAPLLGEERIGVTKEVDRFVDRDVLHRAIHV